MSLHPSLRPKRGAAGLQRNVLKRHERVRHLLSQGLWAEGRSVMGLPKIKQAKIKTRKASPQEKKAEATSADPAAPTSPQKGSSTASS